MKIPENIRISGIDYNVCKVENIIDFKGRTCYGRISFDNSTIELDPTKQRHQYMCISLWHEILHGIIHHAGFKLDTELEEDVVDMLAKGIYQILQDNGRQLFDMGGDAD